MHVRLPCNPASPGLARAFVLGELEREGRAHIGDIASLLVSELVTNAYLHANSGVDIRVRCRGPAVSIEVADNSPQPPAVRDTVPHHAGNGRGLQLVQALADDWGNEITQDGKIVWFRIEAEPANN